MKKITEEAKTMTGKTLLKMFPPESYIWRGGEARSDNAEEEMRELPSHHFLVYELTGSTAEWASLFTWSNKPVYQISACGGYLVFTVQERDESNNC